VSCCRPNQDGTCCGDNGHVQKPEPPISARIVYALADEVSARADGVREIYHHASHGNQYDELTGLLLRVGQYLADHRCSLADLQITHEAPEPTRTTDARWLAAQANLYASQHGRRESEVASMLRAASFLCAARGASLEDLHVVVESFGEGKP
jgi:hypothetical protein